MRRVKMQLSDDVAYIVDRVYKAIEGKEGKPFEYRACMVFESLLNQWDTTQEMFDPPDAERPVEVPSELDEAMRSIAEPDIGLNVRVRDHEVTPRDTDGLVPWDYIKEGYPKLPFVAALVKDYSDLGKKKVALVRTILTRIPEDQWESEQTRSIVARALLVLPPTKSG